MLDQNAVPEILKTALLHGGEFAEVYCERRFETNIIFEDKSVKSVVSGQDQGTSLRLIKDLKTLFGFSNHFDPKALIRLATNLVTPLEGKALSHSLKLRQLKAATLFPIQSDPFNLETARKVAICKSASEQAWQMDKRVQQVSVNYHESHKHNQIGNSLAEWIDFKTLITSLSINVTVRDQNGSFTCGDLISGHAGLELICNNDIAALVKKTVQRALMNLTAPRAPAGAMMVVLAGQAGGTIIHEAVGHGLEADLVFDDMSIYQNKIGQKVAAKNITMVDDATLPQKRGSFSFDDEGVPSQRTLLIENGILKNYLTDRLSAMKIKQKPTGNGRRESYEYLPIPRMTNTYLLPGNDQPEDILLSVEDGLYVTDMGGGQVNTVNGDFVFDCTEAYLIEKGKVKHPVKNATLIGNGAKVLSTIDRVGNDLGFSAGTCGKNDQSVPVTDGMPTIRIPEIVVGDSH